MPFWLVFLFLIAIGLSAWGFALYRRQRGVTGALQRKMNNVNAQLLAQEEDHRRDKIRWEQTEEKLRGFLQLMDTLMNTIPNPIYFKDTDGVIQGCNRVFAKQILGLSRDRIIGHRLQELGEQIPPELSSIYLREERKMTQKGGFHSHEAPVRCVDGKHRDFLFNLAPVMDGKGEISGSVAVLSDLTDKNRAARNRLQKEKLEGVLETAGAVCHELNQPLQALSGYSELIAMRLPDAQAKANVRKMSDQIDRMRDITDKLQRITRYETTDYSTTTKIIDIEKASGEA